MLGYYSEIGNKQIKCLPILGPLPGGTDVYANLCERVAPLNRRFPLPFVIKQIFTNVLNLGLWLF